MYKLTMINRKGKEKAMTREELNKIIENTENREINFFNIDLRGVDFGGQILGGLTFKKVNFKGVSFKGANLAGSMFIDCNMQYADLEGADLANTVFFETDLTDASLKRSNMLGTAFKNSCCDKIDSSEATVKNVIVI